MNTSCMLLACRVRAFTGSMLCDGLCCGAEVSVGIAVCRDIDVAFGAVLWWSLVLSKRLGSRVRKRCVTELPYGFVLYNDIECS